MIEISIIGTAGRGTDAHRLNNTVYQTMVKTVTRLINTITKEETKIISGGAAYADHIAVELFLQDKAKALTLHLPSPWDYEQKKIFDIGIFDWKQNPGGTANHYHRKFSNVVGKNTLLEIDNAIKKGAEIAVGDGFKNRNTEIARADICIALTFGNGVFLKEGGTSDTMTKYLKTHQTNNKSYHIDLHTMTLFKGAKI